MPYKMTIIYRPVSDNEQDVMQRFARHASNCPRCQKPFVIYQEADGHAHARDPVAGEAIPAQIPTRFLAVRKAVEQSLKIANQKLGPVVIYDLTCTSEQRKLSVERDECAVLEVAPQRREEGGGKGERLRRRGGKTYHR
jgi:hypothetical protein